LGGLDWEKTLSGPTPLFKPGLLSQANNGLVYIDEVNLLAPSLAHLILDVASSGVLRVESEGFSFTSPALFALVGSMNPEEGPLGPQLSDRFALTVELAAEEDREVRAQIVRRALAFERDPKAFRRDFQLQSLKLAKDIERARAFLEKTNLSEEALEAAALLSLEARAAGHRADLAMIIAAKALKAFESAQSSDSDFDKLSLTVGKEEIERVSEMALRARRRPVKPCGARIKGGLVKLADKDEEPPSGLLLVYQDSPPDSLKKFREAQKATEPTMLTIFEAAEPYKLIAPKRSKSLGVKDKSGRRGFRPTLKARGRPYKTTARRLGRPLSLSATLRAAAPYQKLRKEKAPSESSFALKPCDFREKVYRLRTGRLVIFVVDSSGSVGTLYRVREAKSAALALLSEAYIKRDRVGLIAFYGSSAQVLLPPTDNPDLAGRLLRELPSGGKTPLAAALALTDKIIRIEQAKDPRLKPFVILMTDGRPNVPMEPALAPWPEALKMAKGLARDPNRRFLLIDTDRGAYNEYKLTKDLAESLNCPMITLEDLRTQGLSRFLQD
jgi:magnesium chelatase subunit D